MHKYYSIASIMLGIVAAYLGFEAALPAAKVCSMLFVRAMQCLAVPIVFFSLLTTVQNAHLKGDLRKLFLYTSRYTVLTTLAAAALSVALYKALDLTSVASALGVNGTPLGRQGSYTDALWALLPSNVLDVFIKGNVIGAIMAALILGFVGRSLPEDVQACLHKGASVLSALFLQCAQSLVRILPCFLWSFTFLFVHDLTHDAFTDNLVQYALVILLTNTLHACVLLPLLLLWKRFSVWRTFCGAFPAISVAALTKSSALAIPTTLHVSINRFNVQSDTAKFTVPVCATINMNGCAAFILVTSIFMIECYHGPLPLWGFGAGAVIASLMAIGNAGVPMGCFFLTTSFLGALDVPTHLMGMILPFFLLLDMYETGINVWSDIIVTRCVDYDLKSCVKAKADT